jgi:catechol 2,3-dioxygenase-like lactoylglutathione lyase family enzyme
MSKDGMVEISLQILLNYSEVPRGLAALAADLLIWPRLFVAQPREGGMAQVTAPSEVAIPTLPAKDIEETIAFYGGLGFKLALRIQDPQEYIILRKDSLELHFFPWPEIDPASNFSGCYMRVRDVDVLYEGFSAARLPARGIPSLGGIEKKFYDMREFRLVDPSGNLLRVGEQMKKPAKGAAQR